MFYAYCRHPGRIEYEKDPRMQNRKNREKKKKHDHNHKSIERS